MSGKRPNFRDALITLLLHGAGFRVSEPFHLFLSDVHIDPYNSSLPLVLIHHPEFGIQPKTPNDFTKNTSYITRDSYLGKVYGTAPRTKVTGSKHAGFKSYVFDEKYFQQAYWFDEIYGELFLDLWKKYLVQVTSLERKTPYAFINIYREPIGVEYSISQYRKSHARACRKIGLVVNKSLGTTPHGHRHAYGQRLRRANIDKVMIKRFMHHGSIESQEVYTYPSMDEIRIELSNATKRIRKAQTAEE